MFAPSARVRVYVCREPTDMRKSFAGLQGLVRGILERDPLSGHLFCFFNRRCNYVKVLWWDVDGFCIWAKKLTKGSFTIPAKEQLSLSQLQHVLDGIDLKATRKKKRLQYFSDDP